MMRCAAGRCGFVRSRVLVVAIATLAMLALAPSAWAGFGDLGGYFGFHLGDTGVGPGIPPDVPQSTGQITSPDGQSVKLFGSFGPIKGENWDLNFVFLWQGGYDSPIHIGDTYTADLDFTTNVTGGQLSWHYFAEMPIFDAQDYSRIDTPFNVLPMSAHVSGVHLVSDAFTADSPDGAPYTAYLQLDWTGYAPTDTLTLNVPQNSIDASFVPVPEPMSASLACIAIASLMVRRRRWAAGSGLR